MHTLKDLIDDLRATSDSPQSPPTPAETPLTEAAIQVWRTYPKDTDGNPWEVTKEYIEPSFARTLETRLAACEAERDEARAELKRILDEQEDMLVFMAENEVPFAYRLARQSIAKAQQALGTGGV